MIVYKFDNNQLEKHFPDGTKQILFNDGTLKIVMKDGYEETFFTDGRLQKTDLSGTITVEYDNGMKVYKLLILICVYFILI